MQVLKEAKWDAIKAAEALSEPSAMVSDIEHAAPASVTVMLPLTSYAAANVEHSWHHQCSWLQLIRLLFTTVLPGHNYIGHNYIGHNYIGHYYIII